MQMLECPFFQALISSHSLLFLTSVVARIRGLRMTAVRATLDSFPLPFIRLYSALRSGLCRMATRAGM